MFNNLAARRNKLLKMAFLNIFSLPIYLDYRFIKRKLPFQPSYLLSSRRSRIHRATPRNHYNVYSRRNSCISSMRPRSLWLCRWSNAPLKIARLKRGKWRRRSLEICTRLPIIRLVSKLTYKYIRWWDDCKDVRGDYTWHQLLYLTMQKKRLIYLHI